MSYFHLSIQYLAVSVCGIRGHPTVGSGDSDSGESSKLNRLGGEIDVKNEVNF